MSAELIAQMRAQRTTWLDIGDGVTVAVMRPTALQIASILPRLERGEVLKADLCIEHATGWRGVTEATLLGAAVGSSAPVEFAPALWAEVAADRPAWVAAVANEVMRLIEAHIMQRADAAKKSSGSSTSSTTGSCGATTDPSPAQPSV